MPPLRNTNYKLQTKLGFTLIEILLSVALISIIAGVGIPIYQSFQVRNDLDIAVRHYAEIIRRSQLLSQGVAEDSVWGVKAQAGLLTLFKGGSYALRDSSYDEEFSIPSNMAISGADEFVFAKLTGFPNAQGSTTFTSVNNDAKTVTLNGKGIVSY